MDIPLLCLACEAKMDRLVQRLLDHPHCDVQLADERENNTILHLALLKGHLRLVEQLLPRGLLLRADKRGFTPLHIAARRGKLELLHKFFGQWRRENGQHVRLAQGLQSGDLQAGSRGWDASSVTSSPPTSASRVDVGHVTRSPATRAAQAGVVDRVISSPVTSASRVDVDHLTRSPVNRGFEAGVDRVTGSPVTSVYRVDVDHLTRSPATRGLEAGLEDRVASSPVTGASEGPRDPELSPPHSRPKEARLEDQHLEGLSAEEVCQSWKSLRQLRHLQLGEALTELRVKGSDNTMLHLAATGAHVSTVRYLLAHGADVDVRNDERMTPLMCLVGRAGLSQQAEEAARALIEAGCDCNLPGAFSHSAPPCRRVTPLAAAARRNSIRMVDLLLAAGAGASTRADGEDTALMAALRHRACEAAWHMLSRRPRDGLAVNHQDRSGDSALHLAASCQRKRPEIAELLLRRGADAKLVNSRQHTPLTLAISLGALDVVETILRHRPGLLSHGSGSGSGPPTPCSWQSALHHCLHPAASNSLPMVHLLLRHGADINAVQAAMTPLERSLAVQEVHLTHLLVSLGCRVRDTAPVRSFLSCHRSGALPPLGKDSRGKVHASQPPASPASSAAPASSSASPASSPAPVSSAAAPATAAAPASLASMSASSSASPSSSPAAPAASSGAAAPAQPPPHRMMRTPGLDRGRRGRGAAGDRTGKDDVESRETRRLKILEIVAYLTRYLNEPPSLLSLCADAVRSRVRCVGRSFADAAQLPLPESLISTILYKDDPGRLIHDDEVNVVVTRKP